MAVPVNLKQVHHNLLMGEKSCKKSTDPGSSFSNRLHITLTGSHSRAAKSPEVKLLWNTVDVV